MKNRYVLDTFSVLAYIWGEPGEEKVRELLLRSRDRKVELFLSDINLAETYYLIGKREGKEEANRLISMIVRWPLCLVEGDKKVALIAGRVKADYALSFADAFAVATALDKRARVVTGDEKFRRIEDMISVFWITR